MGEMRSRLRGTRRQDSRSEGAIARCIAATCRLLIGACGVSLVWLASAAPAGAAALTGAPPAANASYMPVDFPGATWTDASGIYRSPQLGHPIEVVGSYDDIQGIHGFLVSGGRYTKLDVPVQYAISTRALGINAQQQVVGTYYNSLTGCTCGFLYYDGTYAALGVLGPTGINNSDDIVGNWNGKAFLATPNGTIDYSLPGGVEPELYGVNNSPAHQVVGYYSDGHTFHGVLFSGEAPGVSFDVPGAVGTVGHGINDTGQIVGSFIPARGGPNAGYAHGFVDDNGRYEQIDYPGAEATVVNGVSEADSVGAGAYTVVGNYSSSSSHPVGEAHGFVATVSKIIGSQP
jgi:hypothetical protein